MIWNLDVEVELRWRTRYLIPRRVTASEIVTALHYCLAIHKRQWELWLQSVSMGFASKRVKPYSPMGSSSSTISVGFSAVIKRIVKFNSLTAANSYCCGWASCGCALWVPERKIMFPGFSLRHQHKCSRYHIFPLHPTNAAWHRARSRDERVGRHAALGENPAHLIGEGLQGRANLCKSHIHPIHRTLPVYVWMAFSG